MDSERGQLSGKAGEEGVPKLTSVTRPLANLWVVVESLRVPINASQILTCRSVPRHRVPPVCLPTASPCSYTGTIQAANIWVYSSCEEIVFRGKQLPQLWSGLDRRVCDIQIIAAQKPLGSCLVASAPTSLQAEFTILAPVTLHEP